MKEMMYRHSMTTQKHWIPAYAGMTEWFCHLQGFTGGDESHAKSAYLFNFP